MPTASGIGNPPDEGFATAPSPADATIGTGSNSAHVAPSVDVERATITDAMDPSSAAAKAKQVATIAPSLSLTAQDSVPGIAVGVEADTSVSHASSAASSALWTGELAAAV